MIKEIIIKTAISEGLKKLINTLNTKRRKLVSTKDDIEKAIQLHVKSIYTWSNEISFYGLVENKRVLETYQPLLISAIQAKHRNTITTEKKFSVDKIFEECSNHIALLGHAGSGKTTSMKFLCQKIITDPNYYPELFNFPIRLRLREVNSRHTQHPKGLLLRLMELLNIQIDYKRDLKRLNQFQKNLISDFIDSLGVLLIFDGLDEVSSNEEKNLILDELFDLTTYLSNSRIIVTSRIGDFHYNFTQTKVLEISPMNDKQIREFSLSWLKNKEKSANFLQQIKDYPLYDTLLRPLNLAQLCAIFEQDGEIPEKPKSTYKKIIELLIEKWDAERRIKRVSKYGAFRADRKFDFLCHLAYQLTIKYKKTVFSNSELSIVYSEICKNFSLPIGESQKVVNEIESHNGIFVKSGADSFEFSHKSLQEYLSAEYLVKLPFLPNDTIYIKSIPNELAIAVSLSSNPSMYFAQLILIQLRIETINGGDFLPVFVDRILIEKPDFYADSFVGIAFLYLYDLTKTEFMPGQLSNARQIIMKLYLHNSGVQKSVRELLKYYTVTSSDNKQFVKLECEAIPDSEFDIDEKYIPKELTCNPIFLR